MSKTKPSTDETFIIQNVTSSYHYISDLKLNLGPLEVMDLTHKDPHEIKGSQNLKDSLRAGYVRKITQEAADVASARKTAKMRKDVTKLQQSARTEALEVDGRTLDVEPLNISRTDSSKMSEQVTTAGYANDPLSYAVALEIAQAQAEARGGELSVEEFAEKVAKDSDIVRRLITANTEAVTSAARNSEYDSGAYFAEVDDDTGKSTVGKKRMSPPPTAQHEDHGGAEVIDLTQD